MNTYYAHHVFNMYRVFVLNNEAAVLKVRCVRFLRARLVSGLSTSSGSHSRRRKSLLQGRDKEG